MKRRFQAIPATFHVGGLPRPDDLMAPLCVHASDDNLQPRLRAAIGDIVHRQAEIGVDIVNDGEYGKAMRSSMDFGAWWSLRLSPSSRLRAARGAGQEGRGAWTFGGESARISLNSTPPKRAPLPVRFGGADPARPPFMDSPARRR